MYHNRVATHAHPQGHDNRGRDKHWLRNGLALSAVVLAGGVVFGGTAWADEAAPAVGSGPSAAASNSDTAFVRMLRQHAFFGPVADAELTKLGHLTCQAFDQGATSQQLVDALQPVGFATQDTEWLEGASVVSYCPGHSSKVPGSFKANRSPADPSRKPSPAPAPADGGGSKLRNV